MFQKPRVDTPFLKSYIWRANAYPRYVPTWVRPGAWGLFALLFAISIPINLNGMGIVIAGILAWAAASIVSGTYKPTTDEDRFEDMAFGAIRRLKFLFAEGIGNKVPTRILAALEKAVEAYNTAVARLAFEDPLKGAAGRRELELLLHACFVAAMPMIKDEQHSRKEWQRMKENTALIGQIVEAIDRQSSQMLDFALSTQDRVAALGELGLIDTAEQESVRARL